MHPCSLIWVSVAKGQEVVEAVCGDSPRLSLLIPDCKGKGLRAGAPLTKADMMPITEDRIRLLAAKAQLNASKRLPRHLIAN